MSGIQFRSNPTISVPERREFVQAFRQLLKHSRFGSLDELGEQLRPKQGRQRLSELTRAAATACRRAEGDRRSLPLPTGVARAAAAAASGRGRGVRRGGRAHAARVPAGPPRRRGRRTASDRGGVPDWERLGVHRPIRHLSSGQDLTERVLAGELPTYVEREKDRTELRPALAAANAGGGPPVRWFSSQAHRWPERPAPRWRPCAPSCPRGGY
jgi:hypothetical protein